MVITEYSSVAFDAAYILRTVVYYQFDRDSMFAGSAHTWGNQYFEHNEDGFGPVCTSPIDLTRALMGLAEHGFQTPGEFQERARRTFPQRDGQCCARVTAAVEALGRSSPHPRHLPEQGVAVGEPLEGIYAGDEPVLNEHHPVAVAHGGEAVGHQQDGVGTAKPLQ